MFTSIKSSITNTGGQYASTSVSYILNIPQEKEEKRDKQTEKNIVQIHTPPQRQTDIQEKRNIV
jgi:hypothetical protein